jgi:hypothetical protein
MSSAQALDSGYIKAVKADAAEFRTHEFQAPAESSWLGDANTNSAQFADLRGFSEFIRTKSPGSYIFYKKLSDEYKQRLYKDYLSTGDLARAKQDIFNYTREMKKNSRTNQYNR